MQAPRNDPCRRRGFTLIEIMLVIVILVAISALSWPYFERWFVSHRLRDGVDKVRENWVRTRTYAMEKGVIVNVKIDNPYKYPVWHGEPDDTGLLPEGVQFSRWLDASSSQVDGYALLGEVEFEFRADGSARIYRAGMEIPEVTLVLTDRQNREGRIELRGINGNVSARIVQQQQAVGVQP